MAEAGVNFAAMLRIFESATVSDVLEVMYQSCLDIGADKFSYHPEVMFEGVASARSEVYSRGFPKEWMDLYLRGGAKLVDPVPDLVMQIGKPITWRDAVSRMNLHKSAVDYLEAAREHGLMAGLGFPLWGPKGHNAFVSIGFSDPQAVLSSKAIKAEHALLMAGHQKIVELVPVAATVSVLSTREIEVLTWIGRGKSNTDVGTILAISPETVATYIRRIFSKLDCNDRIGAVIKALKMGLIRV